MAARLLLTNAGNAPSNNVARSLRAGAESVSIIGCNDDQFILKKSDADRNYLVPHASHPKWLDALRRIVETERIDLIIPTTDIGVDNLSRVRKRLAEHLFLPRASVLEICGDKYRLSFIYQQPT